MDYGTCDWVKEESQIGATIKTEEETADTSTGYIEIEIDLNHLKHEPELEQSVEIEPAILVKKKLQRTAVKLFAPHTDDSEQQCAEAESTPAVVGSLCEANSKSQGDCIVKPELDEVEIGPTVLQHMDIHYALNKSTGDGCNKVMRCSGVKKTVEDKLRDTLTPQEAMKKKRIHVLQSLQNSVQEPHLAACSVDATRMDVFQCDLCHTVYAEKGKLLLHLQTVHAYLPQTTLVVKFRKTNKRTAANEKATSHNCGLMTTEMDYDETRIESHLGQQMYLQMHLHQQRTTSSSGFKCDGTFHKRHLLGERNKLHQRNNRNAVTTTGAVAGPSNQNRDKSTKTKQKPFELKVCEKGYLSKVHFNLLKRSHSKVELKNQGKKSHGDEKFAQSGDLTKHIRVHTGEKPFQCKICDTRCAKSGGLTKHMRIHTGEKPFQCVICDARFAQRSNLTQHMRIHSGEKPYQCEICDAKFTQNSNLTKHIRTHTGDKPFQCNICDARFTQSNSLTQHMKIHTGEKPFPCKICDAKFTQRSVLKMHNRVHTGEKPYICETCDAKFARRGVLIVHMRVHRGENRFSV